MAASVNDQFMKVGAAGTATTLAAPGHSISGTTITVGSTTNWPTDTGVVFAIRQVDSDGVLVPGTYTEWRGTVSGSTITNMTLEYGTDQVYPAGSTTQVYLPVSADRDNRLVDGLLVSHQQDGTMIPSLPLTTPKITTSINDANGNEVIKTPATASAVNEITVTNAATGNAPKISATGGDTNTSLNLAPKGTGVLQYNGQTLLPSTDYVVSGLVISGDAYGSTRNYSITSGVVFLGGKYLTVASVSAQSVTASKDRYIDVRDNGDGTATYITQEVNNNAASPSLTSGDMRVGIVVAGASNIANVGSINQGQQDKVLPIASSVAYTVTDSLGNLICNRTPNPILIGYKQIIASDTTGGTAEADVAALAVPVIVPTGRQIKITVNARPYNISAASGIYVNIKEGATFLQIGRVYAAAVNAPVTVTPEVVLSPTAGLHTYKVSYSATAGGKSIEAASNSPSFIKVELV